MSALLVAVLGAVAGPAGAAVTPGPGIPELESDGLEGSASIRGEQPEVSPGGGGSGAAPADSRPACFDGGGSRVECVKDGGTWNAARGCYVYPYPAGLVPFDSPLWGGRTDGAIYGCSGSGAVGDAFLTDLFWAPDGDAAVLIDPEVLVWQAIAELGFRALDIGIVPEDAPGRVGLVGLPVWLCVDNPTATTFGPASAARSVGPVSVSLSAELTHVVWRLGDGTTVRCERGELSTPYEDRFGDQDSPDCGHRYTRTSVEEPGMAYTVSATSYWQVVWSGGGRSVVIPMNFTSATQIQVGELQVLVQ